MTQASQRNCKFKQIVEHVKQLKREFNSINIKPVAETGHDAFRAIARMQRAVSGRPSTLKVLMDPGAEINLVKGEFLKGKGKHSSLKQHATLKQNIELTNNGIVIGHIYEAVYLSFVLDTVAGVAPQTYSEWFHVFDDLHEELVLGSEFCKLE